MEVDVRGRPEVSAGSMSLHTSLLMGGIIYLGTISKLLNELIEADSGVLSVHLVGLLILDKNLVKRPLVWLKMASMKVMSWVSLYLSDLNLHSFWYW